MGGFSKKCQFLTKIRRKTPFCNQPHFKQDFDYIYIFFFLNEWCAEWEVVLILQADSGHHPTSQWNARWNPSLHEMNSYVLSVAHSSPHLGLVCTYARGLGRMDRPQLACLLAVAWWSHRWVTLIDHRLVMLFECCLCFPTQCVFFAH